jgi:hypothetical protein
LNASPAAGRGVRLAIASSKPLSVNCARASTSLRAIGSFTTAHAAGAKVNKYLFENSPFGPQGLFKEIDKRNPLGIVLTNDLVDDILDRLEVDRVPSDQIRNCG